MTQTSESIKTRLITIIEAECTTMTTQAATLEMITTQEEEMAARRGIQGIPLEANESMIRVTETEIEIETETETVAVNDTIRGMSTCLPGRLSRTTTAGQTIVTTIASGRDLGMRAARFRKSLETLRTQPNACLSESEGLLTPLLPLKIINYHYLFCSLEYLFHKAI